MAGISDPKVIDLIVRDSEKDEVILIISETREWDEAGEMLLELQEKLHYYLDVVEQGALIGKYPEMAGKPVRIRLDTLGALGKKELEFLKLVKSKWLVPLNIGLEWGLLKGDGEPHEVL